VPAFGAPGVVWRPRPPENGKVTETIWARLAGKLLPIAWRDLRWHKAAPSPAVGTIMLVGYGGGYLRFKDVDAGGGAFFNEGEFAVTCPSDGPSPQVIRITLRPLTQEIDIVADMTVVGKTGQQFVALENLVRAELAAVKTMMDGLKTTLNAHVHTGVTAGTVSSGPPAATNTSSYTVGNVAATRLKAE
jgi:hypothetical protein